nr:hypothetical protein Iba_chr08aCG9500 [Ipomoea batatas]
MVGGPSPDRDEEELEDLLVVDQIGARSAGYAPPNSTLEHLLHLLLYPSRQEEEHFFLFVFPFLVCINCSADCAMETGEAKLINRVRSFNLRRDEMKLAPNRELWSRDFHHSRHVLDNVCSSSSNSRRRLVLISGVVYTDGSPPRGIKILGPCSVPLDGFCCAAGHTRSPGNRSMLMAALMNALSKNGTRASKPHADVALLALKQSYW